MVGRQKLYQLIQLDPPTNSQVYLESLKAIFPIKMGETLEIKALKLKQPKMSTLGN